MEEELASEETSTSTQSTQRECESSSVARYERSFHFTSRSGSKYGSKRLKHLCLEIDSGSTTGENASCVSENRPSYEDLQKQLIEMERALEDSKSKNEKLETEVEKVRAHAFNLSEKCAKLENRVFSLDKFISDEDIAFYTGFPSYAAFMATYTYINPGENGENIRYWRSVQNDVDPEYYEREPELGVGPGRPRTLNSKEEFFLVMCRLRQGFAERHLGHLYSVSQSTVSRIVISWVNFMYLRFGQLNIWPSRKVVDDTMPQDFQSSISDREITERSGFLDLPFDANDSVMADKGFTIQDLLPIGVSLNIPPF
ncbi:hypothetical protein ACROYT_G015690 [Oculina patagonica]